MSEYEMPDDPGWEPHVVLSDGRPMPLIGAGTQYGFSKDGHDRGRTGRAAEYVALALSTGFRLLDTARGYGTEAHVMRGIESSGISRRHLFVISKTWPGLDQAAGPEPSRSAIAESASRLGGYVDLYLVHQPVPGWQDLWRSLEDARDEGVVKSIGVSNFRPGHLEELRSIARYPAVANEILLHPFVYEGQSDTVQYCRQHGIAIIAYPRSPWNAGAGTAVDAVADRCGRTRAQVMLRWSVDHGFAVIPLSTRAEHLAENFAVRDFHLTPEQLREIDQPRPGSKLEYSVDRVDQEQVAGWAFAAGGLTRIRVLVNGDPVGDATRGLPRPDVQRAHPDDVEALECGFRFRFPEHTFEEPGCRVALRFELGNGERIETKPAIVPPPG